MSVRVYRVLLALLVPSLVASTLLVSSRGQSSATASAAFTPPTTFPLAETNSLINGFTSAFVPNVGQTDDSVTFQTNALGGTVFFTEDAIVLALPTADPTKAPVPDPIADERQSAAAPPDSLSPTVLQVRFDGANTKPAINGTNRLPGVINIIKGSDPDNWHTAIPTYAGVVYEDIYPGIDLHYESEAGHLKGTYHVAPGADPRQIRWQYDGATDAMRVDPATGSMQVPVPAPPAANATAANGDAIGMLEEQAPVAWQEDHDQREDVAVSYSLDRSGWVSFDIGEYDPSQPLILDPLMNYSTYISGSFDEEIRAIAVGPEGDLFITGNTLSTDFPVDPIRERSLTWEVFVTRVTADGSAFVYGTYLGDTDADYGEGIAVDPNGNAYVTGRTFSTDFPTTTGVVAANNLPSTDAFVTRLTADGSISYSTYLGGQGVDQGLDIAVDAAAHAYVTGQTTSADLIPAGVPSFQDDYGGTGDAFVVKLNPTGTGFTYATYLGGDGFDFGRSIALDSDGHAYVTGHTSSPPETFPLRAARQSNNRGNDDAFVSKLNTTGDDLVYSTFHGGIGRDWGRAIAVDSEQQAYITGDTQSLATSFPLSNTLQSDNRGATDAFVSKYTATGDDLVYSTYLGGNELDRGTGIAVDQYGQAHVTGYTASSNFPRTDALRELSIFGGGRYDAFVTTYHPLGQAIMHSSFLGGGSTEYGEDIALDRKVLPSPDPDKGDELYVIDGINLVTGYTFSSDFPTYNALDSTPDPNFRFDGFVTKLAPYPAATTSYYITNSDENNLYNLGCRRGERDRDRFGTQDTLVILAFGRPGEQEEGVYGAVNLAGNFLSVVQIQDLAQRLAQGYRDCVGDNDDSRLTLAISTSNFYDENVGNFVTFEHGAAWGELVDNVQQWLIINDYDDRVTAAGASNMEVGWNTPEDTRNWVDGYIAESLGRLYNVGDAQGCRPISEDTDCDNGWEQEDIWYISWGASPRVAPIPQIYGNNGINAQQWYEIARYSIETRQNKMLFAGALTQYNACDDRPDYYREDAPEEINPDSNCREGDQFPEQGWRYLWTELNNDDRTAHILRWSSDIRWDYFVEE